MAAADDENLTNSRSRLDGTPTGNVGKLLAEMRAAKVELITKVDGVKENHAKSFIAKSMVRSLDAVLTKRPPEEVVQASLRRIAARSSRLDLIARPARRSRPMLIERAEPSPRRRL